jgi:hypothetical protein
VEGGGERGERTHLILEGRGVPAGPHGVGSKDGPSEATRPAAGLMFCKPPVPNTAITGTFVASETGEVQPFVCSDTLRRQWSIRKKSNVCAIVAMGGGENVRLVGVRVTYVPIGDDDGVDGTDDKRWA